MTVRLTILISKLDTISRKDFHEYWSQKHPKLWLSVKIVQSNVIKYSQFHVDGDVSDGLKASGLPVAEYDGAVNIWAATLEDLMAIFHDEEYLRVVVPDEESFLKRSEAKMMVGYDEDKWVDGALVKNM